MILFYSISILLFLAYSGLILYYRQSWLDLSENELLSNGMLNRTKISVIIPARNEEENIGACLTAIVKQQYPANLFEVLVVDDHSTDNTADIVRSFAVGNVKLISLNEFTNGEVVNAYKKKAIETAIKQSNGTLIVTTDADCLVPRTWLSAIASFYEKSKPVFIAAPVVYYEEDNFLKKFQSLDFMMLQGITGAAVYKKFHSMCNGANLAYERSVFDEVNGFKDIDNIASGDDMLLMHKIYQKYPDGIRFLKSRQAIVQTKAMDTVADFFNQRIRWASKSDKYDDKKILTVLLIVYFFNLWFIVLAIAALFNISLIYWLLGLLLGKTIVELSFLIPVGEFFSRQKLLWLFPIAQPFHILYTIIAGWLGRFGSYKWKERKVQ